MFLWLVWADLCFTVVYVYKNSSWPYVRDVVQKLIETNIQMLLKRPAFALPRYQRGYAWKSENVEDFWEDLVASVEKNHSHFFGIMYLQEANGVTRILDGQQRITTTALFAWGVREYLQENQIGKFQIKKLDGLLTNNGKLKLTLSRINDSFFQNLLNNKFDSKGDLDNAQNNDSNKMLFNAYDKLCKNIKNYGEKHGTDAVIGLVDHLLDNFSLYTISDGTHDAHKMFNLINNRGIRLAQHELIKSHVFGELDNYTNASDKLFDEIDEQWREITQNIRKGTNYSLNIFFQHILNLTGVGDTIVRDKDIYEVVHSHIGPEQIPSWVTEVKNWSKIVHDLRNPKGCFPIHSRKSHPCESHLERLYGIGAVAVYPLLMAGYKKYWLNGDYRSFNTLTEACLKYHLRTQTIGKADVGKYKKHLFNLARNLYNTEPALDVHQVIVMLKDDDNLYPSNDKLSALLSDYEPKTPVATVLLDLIEEARSDKKSHSTVTVEHIMPRSLNDEWISYISKYHLDCSREEAIHLHKKYHRRLGNLTLLNQGENSKAKNDSFEKKKILYKRTDYGITNELVDLSRWDEDQILTRHDNFTKEILKIIK